ncbi:DNA-binding protein [Sulfurimonas sp. SAG-AH-194-I05]|nr:DNA-binding protein [Sulfurimonas sp. SAG-AH-194-I05]MDF1875203.1 DNA-binding protein [Sulfurimonas sp. SAG-AH-194-I05]
MTTNFEELIPEGVLFSIKQINDMNIIKSDMLKKLIYKQAIEVVKIGAKNFVSRTALILFLSTNTIPATH